MQLSHRLALTGAALGAAGALSGPAAAQTIDVTIDIPRLKVAEYHRPYVAVWLEPAGGKPRTLALWYDYDNKESGGAKWLHDVRQWWRAAGRSMKLPADGITGATRAPGPQKLSFTQGRGALGTLAPGQYTLVVEAAREVGGREMLRLPFAWPPKPGQKTGAVGKTELGAVNVTFGK